MQDLKTGHLCHASPRAQFYGQLIGSSLSIVVTATAFALYNRAYTIPGPSFPAPTAYVWLGLARLLRKSSQIPTWTDSQNKFLPGDGQLPQNSTLFMVIFSLLFGLLSAIKLLVARRHPSIAKWIPSGVAFAIGFLNTPSFSLARLVGGVIEYKFRTGSTNKRDIGLLVVASGFVLGEGLSSIFTLILQIWGFGAISCWGCGHGLCGGCPSAS